MTMQVSKPKGPDNLRAFNPERDMIWAMPRLMRRVFMNMGELSDDKLAAMLEERLIGAETYRAPPCNEPGKAAKRIARMFNTMRDYPEDIEEHAKEYKRLRDEYPHSMALVACMLMDIIFAELPLWFDQVRPQSKLSPVPNIEDIEKAVEEFLSCTDSE